MTTLSRRRFLTLAASFAATATACKQPELPEASIKQLDPGTLDYEPTPPAHDISTIKYRNG